MKKIILALLFAFLLIGVVSATDYKLVKVSDLKTGDIIIDKNGNEIPVTSIQAKPAPTTISDYLNQIVSSNSTKLKVVNNIQSSVGSGSSGTLTGNVIQDVAIKSDNTQSWFDKLISYLRSIKYGANK